uniref:MBD domain-containing protein n=1 Tax=Kalanchoe fedtschenkoi TaxID=63787 RepID=A0A7N0U9U4_KALFE
MDLGRKNKKMINIPRDLVDHEPEEWLPTGWTVKLKFRGDGRRDKYYFSPSGEVALNSKVGVFRYLGLDPKTIGLSPPPKTPCLPSNSSTFDPNLSPEASTPITATETTSPRIRTAAHSAPSEKNKNISRGGDSSLQTASFERSPAEGLPPGWIKEIKIQKIRGKIRRDPYYTDPASGYVFRSMKDSLRYIETGEPGRLAIKPKSPGVTKTAELCGNQMKSQLTDGCVWKSSENSTHEKAGLSAMKHSENSKETHDSNFPKAINMDQGSTPIIEKKRIADPIQKFGKKQDQLGTRDSKIKKEPSLPRRSSGRLAALKERIESQSNEDSSKSMTKSPAEAEKSETFSANNCQSKSSLALSYDESWLDPCIDFAVKTLTGTIPTRKDLNVLDYFGQSQGDGSGTHPSSILNHVTEAGNSSGNLDVAELPPITMAASRNSYVQNLVGSASVCHLVRGTDKSLFR